MTAWKFRRRYVPLSHRIPLGFSVGAIHFSGQVKELFSEWYRCCGMAFGSRKRRDEKCLDKLRDAFAFLTSLSHRKAKHSNLLS